MPTSIRGRLAMLVLASITLVWIFAFGWSYRQAAREVGEWDDARLVQLAQVLVLLDTNDLSILSRTRLDARNEYRHAGSGANEEDGDKTPREVLFEVHDASGRIIASSSRLVPLGASELPSAATTGARTVTLGGQRWHTYVLHGSATGRIVRVLESTNNRSDLTTGVARRIARPIVFALPFLAWLVWISIGRSLAPLKALSSTIGTRDAIKLEPIEMVTSPVEVRPLVDAINQLLSRLRLSMTRERAFTADAAHELKTPLAAIKVQAQVALSAHDAAQQRLAMQRVIQGVNRSAHLAEQLLLLARLDEHRTISVQPIALDALVQRVIAAHEPDAIRKHMRVDFVGGLRAEVIAEPALLDILLGNLIDNAIRYGNSGGRIEVAIRRDAHASVLTVSDNGPGVAAEQVARLTDRFFRVTGASANGSGLGLSIVARIAECFGGKLDFGTGISGLGLAVNISFPLPLIAHEDTASTAGASREYVR